MFILYSVAAAIMGGLGRRLAGGLFGQWFKVDLGDLPVRLFYALVLAVAGAAGGYAHRFLVHGLVFLPWLQGAIVLLAGWAGTTVPMGGIDLGKNSGKVLLSIAGLTLHGGASGAALALVAWWGGYWWPVLVVAGLLMPALYWLGWVIAGERGAQWMPLGFRGGSEIGEATWGAAMGVAAVWAFA